MSGNCTSSKTNHAPRWSFFEGGPCTHFQPWGKIKILWDLHTEHRTVISEWSSFGFVVLVLRHLQVAHWGLVLNPRGRAPTWVHLNVLIMPCSNWTISVCAPIAWWSRRKCWIFGRLKRKWLRPQSITNLCVAHGWKFPWEKHNILLKKFLVNKR